MARGQFHCFSCAKDYLTQTAILGCTCDLNPLENPRLDWSHSPRSDGVVVRVFLLIAFGCFWHLCLRYGCDETADANLYHDSKLHLTQSVISHFFSHLTIPPMIVQRRHLSMDRGASAMLGAGGPFCRIRRAPHHKGTAVQMTASDHTR